MKKIFVDSLNKLSYELNLRGFKNSQLSIFSQQNFPNVTLKQASNAAFARVSDSALRNVFKIPCPIQKIAEFEIFHFKKLRASYKIQEELVCKKCHLSQQCKFKNVPYANLEKNEKQIVSNNRIFHLLLILKSLKQLSEERHAFHKWQSAYLLTESLRILLLIPENQLLREGQIYYQIQQNQTLKKSDKLWKPKNVKNQESSHSSRVEKLLKKRKVYVQNLKI